ncbi:MAG: ABC transporter permease [Prevotella sp.]|nr:ABC transporter permease [Prevotella sp.]
MKTLRRIFKIAQRESAILMKNHIYFFSMVIFPILTMFFFTSLLNEGQPAEMPVGVVDLDNTTTTRGLIRTLDSFQTSHVAAHYTSVNEARHAIQKNEIYAFLYIPRGTTEELLASRQPKISFYYSNVTLLAGGTLFKDLTTISSLGSAAIGSAKLSALGKTEDEIAAFLQPIHMDLHMINNPSANYNVYLSTIMVPGVLMMFIFLITVYSIGTELKFKRSKQWLKLANNRIWPAVIGKLLPQTCIFLTFMSVYSWYLYGYLNFPHPGGIGMILLLSFLTVLASQAFGVFIFGLMPSLRMSMSICSLWAVLGFSLSGATYPVFSMSPMLEAVAQLVPLRHYFMIYQICIFNGYPLIDAWWNVVVLCAIICLPVFTIMNIKRAMLQYVYIP